MRAAEGHREKLQATLVQPGMIAMLNPQEPHDRTERTRTNAMKALRAKRQVLSL
jgi:hypothetical protein